MIRKYRTRAALLLAALIVSALAAVTGLAAVMYDLFVSWEGRSVVLGLSGIVLIVCAAGLAMSTGPAYERTKKKLDALLSAGQRRDENKRGDHA